MGPLSTNRARFPLELGHGEWGSLLGVIDEFRVSDRSWSEARVRADFLSQTSTGLSVTFGELTPRPCSG